MTDAAGGRAGRMPRWPWWLLLVGLLVPFLLPRGTATPAGGPAPPVAGDLLDGSRFDLAEERGRVVVLNFWATWCGPCLAEVPELSAYAREHPEVRLVGVSIDRLPRSRLAAEARRRGVDYPVLPDARGAVAGRYGVTVLPTTVIVDPAGRVARRVSRPLTRSQLERLVEEASGR